MKKNAFHIASCLVCLVTFQPAVASSQSGNKSIEQNADTRTTESSDEKPTGAKPNIVFLFADDLSYDSVGYAGNEEVSTPNIDALAARGVNFTHAYNMGAWQDAVCVSSRKMLSTGKTLWHAHDAKLGPMITQRKLWGQRMKDAGYDTFFAGKWHISCDPTKYYDTAPRVYPGMPNQTDSGYGRPRHNGNDPSDWTPWDKSKRGYWKGGTHWTEVVANDAVEYINGREGNDAPFFMYVAFNAPHDPRQSPKEFADRYPVDQVSVPENFLPEYPHKEKIDCGEDLRDERLAPFPRTQEAVRLHRSEYYSIISHLDEHIGRILTAIDESGQADNTIIIFTSDHGLACGQHGFLGKQNQYEHSVRVPFLMAGPGIDPEQEISVRIYLQDAMPTSLEFAGVEIDDSIEFKSLLPLLRGDRETQYELIYGSYTKSQRMLIHGNQKLIVYPKAKAFRLYDLTADPMETNDLSGDTAHAASAEVLFEKLQSLQESLGDSLDLSPIVE